MRIEFELWCDASRLVDEQCMKTTLLAGFVVWGCVTAANALPPRYEVEFLAADFYATTMSRSGVAAGYDNSEYLSDRREYYGVFTDTTRRFARVEASESFEIVGVSSSGEIAGSFWSAETNWTQLPYVATELGGRTILPVTQGRSGYATHMSDSGVVLGVIHEMSRVVPTTWTRSANGYVRHDLALPADNWTGTPRTMSNNGVIAGSVYEIEYQVKPAVWIENEVQLLDLPAGFNLGSVSHIRGDGVFYGIVSNNEYGTDARMAMWAGGHVTLLPPLQNLYIAGVGPSGEVVAMQFGTPFPPPIWLLNDNEWIPLESLIDSELPFALTDVVGIDDNGRILAHGTRNFGEIDSEWGLVRLVPVPSPGVVGVGAVCFAAMGCARRRDRA